MGCSVDKIRPISREIAIDFNDFNKTHTNDNDLTKTSEEIKEFKKKLNNL